MRHAQRALLIMVEQMFYEGHSMTDEQRDDLARMPCGEVKEVFRAFVDATFAHEDVVTIADRRKLLAIAARLHLGRDVVPTLTLLRAA